MIRLCVSSIYKEEKFWLKEAVRQLSMAEEVGKGRSSSGSVSVCNDRCGCPNPCPGGKSCRCETTQTTNGGGSGDTNMEHMRCSCGDHCQCNPCNCTKTDVRVCVPGGDDTSMENMRCSCGDHCKCNPCNCTKTDVRVGVDTSMENTEVTKAARPAKYML